MTVAPTPTDALLAQMTTLMHCERADGYACVSARREHGARSVDLTQPQFAIVLQGRQQVRSATQSLQLVPGDLFLATRRCRIDLINTPDPQTGLYMSAVVPCARRHWPLRARCGTSRCPRPAPTSRGCRRSMSHCRCGNGAMRCNAACIPKHAWRWPHWSSTCAVAAMAACCRRRQASPSRCVR